jgi:hypothetical protein
MKEQPTVLAAFLSLSTLVKNFVPTAEAVGFYITPAYRTTASQALSPVSSHPQAITN